MRLVFVHKGRSIALIVAVSRGGRRSDELAGLMRSRKHEARDRSGLAPPSILQPSGP
jgi:hypothetical protein